MELDPSDGLVTAAERVGIPNLAEFERCLGDSKMSRLIEGDIAAIKELGATGVPMLLVDDILLGSVPDSAALFELVQERLSG